MKLNFCSNILFLNNKDYIKIIILFEKDSSNQILKWKNLNNLINKKLDYLELIHEYLILNKILWYIFFLFDL